MQPFPHHYTVSAHVEPTGDVAVRSGDLPVLQTNKPVEFDGPGDRWSPEDLLVAAVANCFALTFRGIAAKSRLPFVSLSCDASGWLDQRDRVTQFTHIDIRAIVEIEDDAHLEQARRIAERAEETCLITRSLKATTSLEVQIVVAAPAGVTHPAI